MTPSPAPRSAHELFEERLKTAGWTLAGQGNGGRLNVWEPPPHPDPADDIWVPLYPSAIDYQGLLRRAAKQLARWERARTDADWDAPAAEGAYNAEWRDRKRAHGKHEAAHPTRLRQALRDAEQAGLHLAADALQSLVYQAALSEQRHHDLAEQLEAARAELGELRQRHGGER